MKIKKGFWHKIHDLIYISNGLRVVNNENKWIINTSTGYHKNGKDRDYMPNWTKIRKFSWKLILLIVALTTIITALSCEKEKQYICSDVFTPEDVLIEGEPFTIYHKELVCEEYYY